MGETVTWGLGKCEKSQSDINQQRTRNGLNFGARDTPNWEWTTNYQLVHRLKNTISCLSGLKPVSSEVETPVIKWDVIFLRPRVWLFPFLWTRRHLFVSPLSPTAFVETSQRNTDQTHCRRYGLVLWHINYCWSFNAKSSFYIHIRYMWFGFVWFYGIPTIVGYLMTNSVFTYMLDIFYFQLYSIASVNKVQWFQMLQFITDNSIKYQSFVYTHLNNQTNSSIIQLICLHSV